MSRKKNEFHTHNIHNASQRNRNVCCTKSSPLYVAKWSHMGKGMHEAIWDSLWSCKFFVRRSLFVYSLALEWLDSVGLHLQGVKSNCV